MNNKLDRRDFNKFLGSISFLPIGHPVKNNIKRPIFILEKREGNEWIKIEMEAHSIFRIEQTPYNKKKKKQSIKNQIFVQFDLHNYLIHSTYTKYTEIANDIQIKPFDFRRFFLTPPVNPLGLLFSSFFWNSKLNIYLTNINQVPNFVYEWTEFTPIDCRRPNGVFEFTFCGKKKNNWFHRKEWKLNDRIF